MDWTLEVVILPVSDIGRSVAFYRDQVGFHLDHDTSNEHSPVPPLPSADSAVTNVFGERIWIEAAPDVLRYCVEKGSIAVEGVSLTVAELDAAVAINARLLDDFDLAAVRHEAIDGRNLW